MTAATQNEFIESLLRRRPIMKLAQQLVRRLKTSRHKIATTQSEIEMATPTVQMIAPVNVCQADHARPRVRLNASLNEGSYNFSLAALPRTDSAPRHALTPKHDHDIVIPRNNPPLNTIDMVGNKFKGSKTLFTYSSQDTLVAWTSQLTLGRLNLKTLRKGRLRGYSRRSSLNGNRHTKDFFISPTIGSPDRSTFLPKLEDLGP